MSSRRAERQTITGRPGNAARDYYQWTLDQARLLRSGRAAALDYPGLADEIEDLGRSEYDALQSDLTIILQHMLKWDHQSDRRSRSWELSIREHRRHVMRRLNASPSLTTRLGEAMAEAFVDGRDRALAETDLSDGQIPDTCPYSSDDVLDRPFVLRQDS